MYSSEFGMHVSSESVRSVESWMANFLILIPTCRSQENSGPDPLLFLKNSHFDKIDSQLSSRCVSLRCHRIIQRLVILLTHTHDMLEKEAQCARE